MDRNEAAALREAQQSYIREAADQMGVSVSELARRAKVNPSTLTRFLNSTDHASNLSATTVAKIERLTGLPASAIMTGDLRVPVARLKVIGAASAGVWRDVALANRQILETIPVGPDPRYAGHPQYALKIEGPSIDRKAPDGSYAICVDWPSLGFDQPKDGAFVHVERWRGGIAEVTIKRFRMVNGKAQLFPDSTDPRHQEPVDLEHNDEDTEVRVRGLVIGWHILEG